jgi:alkylhydroperoxidase family enzyme
MQIMMTSAARSMMGKQSLLGARIVELIRIRSAQLGECQPCMQSRKHDSITDEDVACLIAPGGSQLTEQERLAVQFLDLLSADHHAIDDEVYRELGTVFTAAQIIELGFTCANTMGVHRFIHTLDVFGISEPVIAYNADQVDTAYSDVPEQAPA